MGRQYLILDSVFMEKFMGNMIGGTAPLATRLTIAHIFTLCQNLQIKVTGWSTIARNGQHGNNSQNTRS